jgi:hypothetical protein
MYPRNKQELAECILTLLFALACIILFAVLGVREIKNIVENARINHALKQYRKEVTIYNDDDKCAYLTPNSDYFYAVGYLYEDEILGVVIRDTMEILQYSGVPYDKFVSFYYDNAEEWMQEYYEYDIADIYECESLGVLQP